MMNKPTIEEYFDDDIVYNKKKYLYEQVHPVKSRLEKAYWATYRFFKHTLPYIHKEVYWFFQRGLRGWADCDTWSFDTYLDKVIRDGITRLRENKCGYPMGYTEQEWDAILHRISFLADRHLAMINMEFKYTREEYDETVKELFDILAKH